jgi:hypothetical protein
MTSARCGLLINRNLPEVSEKSRHSERIAIKITRSFSISEASFSDLISFDSTTVTEVTRGQQNFTHRGVKICEP